jgi:hypothetical protein
VTAAALLIGGVQATEHYVHTHDVYRTLAILLTRTLAWFAMLSLTAGIVLTLEHGEQHLPGAGG